MPDGSPAILSFAPAQRHAAHVIVTAYGESGCGKTYSLIKLGRGLVGPKGKLGMIDTETGRGRIYANVGSGYLYAELTPPFTPERYIEAIDAAEAAGIEALIIDSGSHEWEGIGGVLELADQQQSQSGKPLQGLVKWAKPKARHKRYVQRLLTSRMHLLISLRAKEKMVQLDKPPFPPGFKAGDIISAGFVPIQDKRFIFETTVQLFLPVYRDRDQLGVPTVEKCPEDLLGAFPAGTRISEATGQRIAEWVSGGTPIDYEFERLKRLAEEAAGEGTEGLRKHWRDLDKTARNRLSGEISNLRSIARAADQEAEERRREREQSHNAFAPIGGADESESDTAAGDEDPFGLPPLQNSPAGSDRAQPPAEAAKRAEASSGPAGETPSRGGGDALASTEHPRTHPPSREPDADWLRRIAALEPQPVDLASEEIDWKTYADQFCALIGEASAADLNAMKFSELPAARARVQDGNQYRRMSEAIRERSRALTGDG